MKPTKSEQTRQREADIIAAGGRKLSPMMFDKTANRALAKLKKREGWPDSDVGALSKAAIEAAKS